MKTKVKHPWFRTFAKHYLLKVIFVLIAAELIFITFFQNKNHAPVAQEDEYSVYQRHEIEMPVLQNDTDKDREDGIELQVCEVSDPQHGTVEAKTRSIHYVPDVDFVGEETLTYRITDGESVSEPAVIRVVVEENLKPVANADEVVVFPWTEEMVFSVLGNDKDREKDEFHVIQFTQPKYGSLDQRDDAFVYRVTGDVTQNDSFTYVISDGASHSEPATVEIQLKTLVSERFCASDPYGNIRLHEQHVLSRWEPRDDNGNIVYGLNTSDIPEMSGERMGAYSVVKMEPIEGDFTYRVRFQSPEDLTKNVAADGAVIFTFSDQRHYLQQ